MRFSRPQYIDRFQKSTVPVQLGSGEFVNVYSIAAGLTDTEKNEWAKHILAHYISTADIAKGARITGKTEQEYIQKFVLPTAGKDKSGEFGEIIFADFIEYILGFTVPRFKQYGKYPNNPTQGVDIIAYKADATNSTNDTVLYGEIKSYLSERSFPILQKAIDEITGRDDEKFSLALEIMRLALERRGDEAESKEVERYSNPAENPCKRIKSAGLITLANACETNDFVGVKISAGNTIETHVIYATDIWTLAQDLWRRAGL
jgi:hypothetical protein